MKTIQLTKGYKAIVDDDDYEELSKHKWQAYNRRGFIYARRSVNVNGKSTTIGIHTVIMDTPIRMEVDHINHNTLDNRKENLRIATHKENMGNIKTLKMKNGFKGTWRSGNKWAAQIHAHGKTQHIGCFDTEIEAAKSYDVAAVAKFGEFACTNFPITEISESEVENMAKLLDPINKKVHSSKFKGVSWNKRGKCWVAYFNYKGEQIHVGVFSSEIDAVAAISYKLNQLEGIQ